MNNVHKTTSRYDIHQIVIHLDRKSLLVTHHRRSRHKISYLTTTKTIVIIKMMLNHAFILKSKGVLRISSSAKNKYVSIT